MTNKEWTVFGAVVMVFLLYPWYHAMVQIKVYEKHNHDKQVEELQHQAQLRQRGQHWE